MAAVAPAPPAPPPAAPAVAPIAQYVVPRTAPPPAPPAAPPRAPRKEEEEEVFYYQEESRPPSGGVGAGEVVLYGLLILAVVLVLFFALVPRGRVGAGRRGFPLAEELAFAGWVLYGRPGCPWCARQLEALGTNQYPKMVTCEGEKGEYTGVLADGDIPLLCKNVQAFPLWVNATTGATRTGFQSVPQLEYMARFPSASSGPGS
jgi:hypothetical protein